MKSSILVAVPNDLSCTGAVAETIGWDRLVVVTGAVSGVAAKGVFVIGGESGVRFKKLFTPAVEVEAGLDDA